MSQFKLKAGSTFINVADKKKVTVKRIILQGVMVEDKILPISKCLNLIKDRVWVKA